MRIAFRMKIHPDQEAEYQDRHNPIWPELGQVLKEQGVLSYSIFLDRETRDLFAFADIESSERWQAIAQTAVCQRWWAYMKPMMPTNDDGSPWSRSLDEVFHIER